MSLRADLLEYADVLEFAGQVLGPCKQGLLLGA